MSLDPYKDTARFLFYSHFANEDGSSEMLSNLLHRRQVSGRGCNSDIAGVRHNLATEQQQQKQIFHFCTVPYAINFI